MKTFWKDGRPSASFVVGAVALLFLIMGYQSALFIRKASVARIVANHDHPDTVYVFDDSVTSDGTASGLRPYSAAAKRGWTRPGPDGRPSEKVRKNGHSTDLKYFQAADEIRWANTPRRYESFRFDPNTASIDDLMRLGFSQKQAQSIDNYRKKGHSGHKRNLPNVSKLL